MKRIHGIVMIILPLLTVACQPGVVRDGQPLDLEDSTGQFGQSSVPGAGDIYVKLAVGYLREGQLDVALVKAKQALAVEPDNAQAHNVIALLYERLGEYDLAERHYKQGLKYQPRNSYMLNAYGTLLCGRQRFEEADKQFQRALENPLYKTPEVALTNAGVCAARKLDLKQAEIYLRRGLEKNPKYPPALLRMSRLSYDNGNFLSARGYLQRYLATSPHTASTLWLGIRIERELGDKNTVASYSLLLRNNFPDAPETQYLRESEQE